MGDDHLKKPVHVAILKPTHLELIRKRKQLQDSSSTHVQSTQLRDPLPPKKPKHTLVQYVPVASKANSVRKQTMLKARLRVVHEAVKPLPAELKPDCGNCKTSACCYAFMVNITKEEYESGLYKGFAVEITPEMIHQLNGGRFSNLMMSGVTGKMQVPKSDVYFLEGELAQPCPMLKDGKCSIYEVRPITCRTYTCVGDDRITQEMRDGDVDIVTGLLGNINANDDTEL